MRRWIKVLGLLILLAGAVAGVYSFTIRDSRPIRVGLLHSRTGPMAVSELPMIDAEVMAIEEINKRGGILGRPIEWIVADGKSDPGVFESEAIRLIQDEKVSVVIGCWTSACRKRVIPIIEQNNHLLMFPVAYEGLEISPRVFHIGASANQQVIPSVSYATRVLKAKTFFFVGTPSVWSRTVNEIVRDQLKAVDATAVGDVSAGLLEDDHEKAIEAILKARPDVVLNSLEGAANNVFFKKLREKGLDTEKTAVISFGVNEDEMQSISAADLAGTYSVGSYFQSINRPENLEFVKRFQTRFGNGRVTSDSISTAYNSVMLWSQAVVDAGSDRPADVRPYLALQSVNAPEGIVSIDRETFHAWRSFFVGKIHADGKIEVVWRLAKPVRAVPFPLFRSRQEWQDFLTKLYREWGENWVAPESRPSPRTP